MSAARPVGPPYHAGAKLPAFRKLVPHVFSTHLLLASPAREQLNAHLAFDSELAPRHGQSGRLGGGAAGHHGLIGQHLKARGAPRCQLIFV